ncbi:mannitol dehydrogenase family protein [Marinobacter sp. SS8-8]|uniref:mannitol dehydrogenase family protein n=1 Tax=Marinobacter sp. SS8-8 TaxID=3050452 RepID=UPI000C36AD9D|nr:mannitol dehydrogenase family protein [Marinobacter sp. SS8-8]MAZ06799.1 mannitol dehydrogenase [Halomonas sp.]|tara:strand:- start:23824 stop:25299 length:1476 start_codon:yes stop_codon:yes gene_type:complete
MKLNKTTLSDLPSGVSRPQYNRANLKHGIVHIGVGGFHRAHQAMYTDRLLQQGGNDDWAICGVGLREADRTMQSVLAEQDCLYTLIELGSDGTNTLSVIGAITDFLFAPDDPDRVIEKLASSDVRIVSLTITEGGYNVDDNTGLFNHEHPDVVHDLQHPRQPRTVFGFLTEALARRRSRGLAPFTIMSCDNLPHNGHAARSALLAFAYMRDAGLAEWIDQQVTFPCSMVDRITPGTTPAHTEWLKLSHGIEDRWPVICEPFTQWVLEDNFCNGRPDWASVGAQFTDNVTPYELMKIRLLNASHSAMAYLGFLAGYRYTHEVMEDSRFTDFIRAFMDEDVTPILGDIPGVDLVAYKATLIDRFSNPQVGDQLARLCLDGSSKIPKFVVPTIRALIQESRSLDRVALVVASWAVYLKGRDETGQHHEIQDPLAERLQTAVQNRDSLKQKFLGMEDLFSGDLINSRAFCEAFESAVNKLESKGTLATLQTLPVA